jgi:1,4-alpha-glucan branching enzyme
MEEDWLFEAVCETYIPLLNVMEGLVNDGVPFRLTFTLTPTLLSMFADPLLQERTRRHVEMLIDLCEREVVRTKDMPAFAPLAAMYLDHYRRCHAVLARCGGDLTAEFRRYRDMGLIEIVTCGATHGFLPLMAHQTEAVRAQIQVAAQHYRRVLGADPQGIWLPECGYFPGLESALSEAGLRYFFIEAHGVLFGQPRPRYGTFAPVLCPNAPVAAFPRDVESSKQVWSANEGYPGDYAYREFYRDVGWDLDYNYVRPYLGPLGERKNLGIKYFRITGPSEAVGLGGKEPYLPALARERAAEHAGNFLFNRYHQMKHGLETLGRPPLIVSPYDAELFGHWWWEGPLFLDMLFRKVHFDQHGVRVVTPHEYLDENPVLQKVQPEFSSWGYKGYAEFWLNETNDWMYRHLHQAGERMTHLARRFETPSAVERRALNQAARELLLAQASDWAFIMKTGTVVEYARKRTGDHLARFDRLFQGVENGGLSEEFLAECELRDNLFPDIDYRVYA